VRAAPRLAGKIKEHSMRERKVLCSLVLILALVVFSGACKKAAPVTTPDEAAEQAETPPPPDPPTREVDEDFPSDQEGFGTEDQEPTDIHELNRMGVLRTVYFAFDSFDLTPSTQSALRQNADWLMEHRDLAVVVQGHCDERGTIEYNLALGGKRANTVRDYLENLGVDRSRIRVVTYGEERPASTGHGESSWSQNRRAEFLLEN
jgi:peptidoglycan-associated lipoprotein